MTSPFLSKMLPLILLIISSAAFLGCASRDGGEFELTIPPPKGDKQKPSQSNVSVSYHQENGTTATKIVEVEGRYSGGEDASPSDVRKKAIEAMVNRAVDLVNGQLISNSMDIRQASYGSGQIEETRHNVISQSVGLGRLVTEPVCQVDKTSGVAITMVCKGPVEVPLIEKVTVIRD